MGSEEVVLTDLEAEAIAYVLRNLTLKQIEELGANAGVLSRALAALGQKGSDQYIRYPDRKR